MSDLTAPRRDVVAIDIETVSLHPAAEVWEFGAVRRSPDGHHAVTAMLANPSLRHADREALQVGRFYDRHPHAPVPLRDRCKQSVQVLSAAHFARLVAETTHGATLLVNNAAFDVPRLERLLAAQGLVPGWHYRPVDVVDMCRGRITATGRVHPDPAPEMWSSRVVSQALGVALPTEEEAHTALGDARWVLRLYDAARGAQNPAMHSPTTTTGGVL
ncbi:hypothetical protein [Serinibacter salmoneus]|nr:hypothetical protein [Serinibacter salmoneus]